MKKLTFILSISLTLSAFGQVPNYVPTDGLVGWWPLDGNINDYSVNSLNGSSNAIFSMGHDGIQNTAVSLNGNNQMITLPGSNLYNTDNFTIHFWTKANNYNIHNKIQYGVTAGAGRFALNWSSTALSYSPFTCTGQYAPAGNGTSASGLNINTWYNVVYTISGNTTNFYLNGVLIDSQSNASSLSCFQTNMNLYFGGDILGGEIEYYSGFFDDIGVWNRVLSANEVFTLYNGCQQTISVQPQSQTVNFSDNVQFSASSSDANATYQWQTNLGLGFQNLTDAGQYSGSATNTLSISNVTLSNNNQQFRCIINSGSCSDTSSVAILTVVDNVGIEEQNQLQLLVYPNPTSSTLTIENLQGLISNFVVVDASGREVLSGKLEGETNSISIAHLSIGKYTITFEQKAIKEIKFIKE
jgi:hypothetical protein